MADFIIEGRNRKIGTFLVAQSSIFIEAEKIPSTRKKYDF